MGNSFSPHFVWKTHAVCPPSTLILSSTFIRPTRVGKYKKCSSILIIIFSDPSILAATLRGHNDAVWSLAYNTSRQQLLSASSDGTIKLWSPVSSKTQPLLRTFDSEAMPTSIDWVKDDLTHMVAAYANAECAIYDIETGNPVIKLDTTQVRYNGFFYHVLTRFDAIFSYASGRS